MKRCTHCEKERLLVTLHGDRGGPEVCIECSTELLGNARKAERRQDRFLTQMISGFGAGLSDDAFGVDLYADTLRDLLQLTHPDQHPPERKDLATRVTAELTEMKSEARSRPEPPSRDGKQHTNASDGGEPVTDDEYPCSSCKHLFWVSHYCDRCRARWEEEREKKRERDRAYRRELRARKRSWQRTECSECGEIFKPARSDSRYCSPACRQKAYRKRKAEG